MKVSESWLREWINPALNRDQLCDLLTMSGFEVDDIIPVAKDFHGIVVGQIIKIEKHNQAQRLHICEVNIGTKILQIVCGAPNVRVGMKSPLALENAVLPNNKLITKTEIKGIASEGMLCSASELELSDDSQGIMEVSPDAPLGHDFRSYLKLEDYILDISITPNRGDCLSLLGISREISALTSSPINYELVSPIQPSMTTKLTVSVIDKKSCPVYIGRIIRGPKVDTITPTWLKERLRRGGVRCINPIVDVTNYVMLELGQPMHAFDLNTIQEEIQVRLSHQGETISLLDGSEKILDAETLVIADKQKPVAIAGVMGGMETSVTLLSKDIFLESAFFMPEVVAKQRQYYQLNSESAYRFERGVDPKLQRQALERATQLILAICGGEAGPMTELISEEDLPRQNIISLTTNKITDVLGVQLTAENIEKIFQALKFQFHKDNQTWIVTVPSYRFDLTLPEDLIEEIARLYGYDKIPTHQLHGRLHTIHATENDLDFSFLKYKLSHLSYHEIISYSFVDKKLQSLLDPKQAFCELINPITNDMTVMRTQLWPGLINTMIYNKSRQQHRIRLFEIGTCFVEQDNQLLQQNRLGGLICGSVFPEQWGWPVRWVDFYDLKGDVAYLFSPLDHKLKFVAEKKESLHPGQTASIYFANQKIGYLGALHPQILQTLDITDKVFVFELDISIFKDSDLSLYQEFSKFPEIRRDLSIIVKQSIPAQEIQDTIKVTAGDWLKEVFIFDVYEGKGISPGFKSIALGLILQHPTRTLVDDEVTALIDHIMLTLKGNLGAELRR